MKRLLHTLIACLSAAALLVVFVPMGVGALFVHNYYPHMIHDLADKQKLKLTLVSTHWGWFSSHAHLRLQLDEKDQPLNITQTIRPGPLLFIPGHGVRLGFAWIGTEHHGKDLPFQGGTLVTPSLRTILYSPHVNITLSNQTIKAKDISYHRFDGHHRNEQTLSAAHLVINTTPNTKHALNAQAAGVSYSTSSKHGELTRTHTSKVFTKHLYLNLAGFGVWEANDLNALITQHDHADTLDLNYQFNAKRLLSPMIAPRQASFDVSFNGINKKALEHLIASVPGLQKGNAAQQFLGLYLLMGELLSHGTDVTLKQFHLSSPHGTIDVSGSLNLPPSDHNRNPAAYALKHAHMQLKANLPQATLIDLLTQHDVASILTVSYGKKKIPMKKIHTVAKKMAYAQMIQWAGKHYITFKGRQVSFEIMLNNEKLYFIDNFQQKHLVKWVPIPKTLLNEIMAKTASAS